VKEDLDSAARYRYRAEKVRKIASETKDLRWRNILYAVADDYDRMARSRERIDRIDREANRLIGVDRT
jgi:hypothetical protein